MKRARNDSDSGPDDPIGTNRAPAITSVTLTPTFGMALLTSFQLFGRATDADGDSFTYNWTILNASNAAISGNIIGHTGNTNATFNNVGLNGMAVTLTPQ